MSTNYFSQDRSMEVRCDQRGCREESMFYGSWSECWEEAKQEGWTAKMAEYDNKWEHKCPLCNHKQKDPTEVFR